MGSRWESARWLLLRPSLQEVQRGVAIGHKAGPGDLMRTSIFDLKSGRLRNPAPGVRPGARTSQTESRRTQQPDRAVRMLHYLVGLTCSSGSRDLLPQVLHDLLFTGFMAPSVGPLCTSTRKLAAHDDVPFLARAPLKGLRWSQDWFRPHRR